MNTRGRKKILQKRFTQKAVNSLEKFFQDNAYPSVDDAAEFIRYSLSAWCRLVAIRERIPSFRRKNRDIMKGEDAHRCLVWFTNRRTTYKKLYGELPPKWVFLLSCRRAVS
jgi:hypothetical protein